MQKLHNFRLKDDGMKIETRVGQGNFASLWADSLKTETMAFSSRHLDILVVPTFFNALALVIKLNGKFILCNV